MELMLEPPSMMPKLQEERGLAVGRQAMFGEVGDGARQRMHRIGDAVVAPAMAARTADGDIEAPAGQGLRSDVVVIGAVQNHKGLNLPAGAGLTAQVAHAAKIALAFFAHVGDEDQAVEDFREFGGTWR